MDNVYIIIGIIVYIALILEKVFNVKSLRVFLELLSANISLNILNIFVFIYSLLFIIGIAQNGNFYNFILPFIVITIIYLSFKLSDKAIKKDKMEKANNGLIYLRDIDVEYSPAILSYLANEKLEKNKDIMATILNLCVKKAINIDNKGIHNIYEEGVTKKLTSDEKYIYECIIEKRKFVRSRWESIVEVEFDEYNFAQRRDKAKLEHMADTKLFIVTTILSFTFLLFLVTNLIIFELITTLLIIWNIIYVNESVFSRDSFSYTQKGANELFRWSKFKAFIKDFTLVNESNVTDVILLEKYLSYSMALNINKKYSNKIMKELNLKFNTNINDMLKEKLETSIGIGDLKI